MKLQHDVRLRVIDKEDLFCIGKGTQSGNSEHRTTFKNYLFKHEIAAKRKTEFVEDFRACGAP